MFSEKNNNFEGNRDNHEEYIEEVGNESLALTDYYAILNVTRDASNEDLKSSYRRLSRLHHPDKQRDQNARLAAQDLFYRIDMAYKVLSNPSARTAYDIFGENCPQVASILAGAESFSLLPVSKDELLKIQESHVRQESLRRLNSLMTQRSRLVIGLNVLPWILTINQNRQRNLKFFQSFAIHNSSEYAVTENIKVGTVCTLENSAERNNRVLKVYCTSQVDATTSCKVTACVLPDFHIKLGITKQLIAKHGVAFVASLIQGSSTSGTLSLGGKLHPKWPIIANIEVSSGIYGYFAGGYLTTVLGWQGVDGRSFVTMSSKQSVLHHIFGLNAGRAGFPAHSMATAGISYDIKTHRGALDWRITSSIGSNFRVGMGVTASVDTGTLFVIEIDRLGQRVVLPVLILPSFTAITLAIISSIVLGASSAFSYGVVVPQQRRIRASKEKRLKEFRAQYLSVQRKDAETATIVLRNGVQSRIAAERSINGLIILAAYYGAADIIDFAVANDITPPCNESNLPVFDASIAIMALVEESKLILPSGLSKSAFIGFYDPCPEKKKTLMVFYQFQDKLYRVSVEEKEGLTCPMLEHAVKNEFALRRILPSSQITI